MVDRIDEHELFCQTDLMIHYRPVGDHCRNCLTCGFFSESKLRYFVFLLWLSLSQEGAFGSPFFCAQQSVLEGLLLAVSFLYDDVDKSWNGHRGLLMWPSHARAVE
jgi:hypothetical protein